MNLSIEQQFKHEMLFREFFSSIQFSLLVFACAPEQGLEICSAMFISSLIITGESAARQFNIQGEQHKYKFTEVLMNEPLVILSDFKEVIRKLSTIGNEKNINLKEAAAFYKNSSDEFAGKYPDLANVFDDLEIKLRKYI